MLEVIPRTTGAQLYCHASYPTSASFQLSLGICNVYKSLEVQLLTLYQLQALGYTLFQLKWPM